MSIEGRIAVDVSFADSATSGGVQSLKKIALTSTTPSTSGKVAVVAGTVGTAEVLVSIASPGYLDSSGTPISFTQVQSLALSSSDSVGVGAGCQECSAQLQSRNGIVATTHLVYEPSDTPANEVIELRRKATAGTASYTLVLYGT